MDREREVCRYVWVLGSVSRAGWKTYVGRRTGRETTGRSSWECKCNGSGEAEHGNTTNNGSRGVTKP